MIKQLKYLLIIFFTAGLSLAQVKLEVIVQSSEVDSLENIFITGNQSEFGSWNPGIVSLNKFKEEQWRKIFYLPQNTQVEFKFTKGSWDSEALNEKGSIPGNISFTIKRDTTLFLIINNWKDSRENLSGQITGKVIYHKNFEGRKVLPRDIVVWLPPGYDSATNKFYPVLYMHDGQNLIDPSTSSFGIDWQIDETTDSLIRKNAIEEIIIIGIYNTYKRRTEYANTNEGYNYINFIIEELKPFIDKTYRTLPDRINTATGGSSMGGLISFIITWQYWDVFSKAACLSPAFKVSEFDFVSTVKEDQMGKKPVKFYIDNGGVGLEEKLLPGINEMLNVLNDKGYKNGGDIYWYYDKTAEHNESAWAKRTWRFLKFMFPKNR